jgi:hypothetical protein
MHDAVAQHIWQGYGWRRLGRAAQHFVRGSNAQQFSKGTSDHVFGMIISLWRDVHVL